MPPPAIVSGPFEVPVGENGCFARVTRSLPSDSVYRCASAKEKLMKQVKAIAMSRLTKAPRLESFYHFVLREHLVVTVGFVECERAF